MHDEKKVQDCVTQNLILKKAQKKRKQKERKEYNVASAKPCLLSSAQERISPNTDKTTQLQCALKGFRESKKLKKN